MATNYTDQIFEDRAPDQTAAVDGDKRLFDPAYLLAIIRRNAWLIAAIIGAALAIALVVTLLMTPRYVSTAFLQIDEAAQRVLGNDEESQPIDTWGYDRFAQTQIDLLTSRAVAERVESDLDLSEDPEFFRATGYDPAALPDDPSARTSLAVTLLRQNLSVDIPPNTRVIPISFEATDAVVATRVINSYAQQFIQANLQRKFDSSAYARSFVSDQLTEAKERLAQSERDLNAYARQQGIVLLSSPTDDEEGSGGSGGSSGTTITTASLSQLNEAANEAQAARIAAEARWNSIAGAPLYSSQPVRNDPTVSSLLARRGQAQAALAEERSRRLAEHPAVQSLQAELSVIETELAQAANSVRRSIRSEYEAARAAENQLASQVGSLKGASLSEQDDAVQYALLAREADTNRQLYDELLQRFKELNAAAGISASNISIVDLAEVPDEPSSPSLPFNLLLGFILGSALAAIAVFLRHEVDDSVRVPEDVEAKLGLALLGVAPEVEGGDMDEALLDPKSPLSEAYGSLRGNLMYATAGGLPPTLLVTSSHPGEGKSTTSRALARAFARIGRKVVLVDGDIRRPTLHRISNVSNDIGLTTVLTGQATLDEAIQMNERGGFAQLTAGPSSPAPGEILASARMQEVIDELAKRYDLVIIDSSPILGLADAPTLSVLVDGVIFVIEAGRAHRGSLKSSLARLRAMRPNLLGAVLTKFDPKNASNSYSSYYGYDYYQYDETDPARA